MVHRKLLNYCKNIVQNVSVVGLREGDLEEHTRQKAVPVHLHSPIPLGL